MFTIIIKIILILSFLGIVFIVLKYNKIKYNERKFSYKELHLHLKDIFFIFYKNSISFINEIFRKINKLKPIISKYLYIFYKHIKYLYNFFISFFESLKVKIFKLYDNINERKKIREKVINKNKEFFEDISNNNEEKILNKEKKVNFIENKEKIKNENQVNENKEVLQVDNEEISGFHEISIIDKNNNKDDDDIDREILEQKEKNLLEAIIKNPREISFYKKLGKVYIAMNNFEDAKNCFQYVIKSGSKDPEIKELLDKMPA